MRTRKGFPTSLQRLAGAVLVFVIPACGGDFAGSAPSADAQANGQKASAPLSALDLATRASNEAIVDSGNPGTTSSASNSLSPSPSNIAFQSAVSMTVNLGARDSMGHPRYPGASGEIHVVATGTASGGGGAGNAIYSVVITAVTDIVFTDPDSGDTGTLLTGASWTSSLQIDWTFTDRDNWGVTAVSEASLSSLSLIVHHQGVAITASASGNRHWNARYSKMAGMFQVSLRVTADQTVEWNDSTGTHSVEFQVAAGDQITLIVDGASFGPFTPLDLELIFHLKEE